MAITDGYVIMQGGYYRTEDMSGPYAIGSDGSVTLIGSIGGSGGGGGQTDGLTDAQLRASALEVTGGLTNAQLRAAPIETVPSISSGGNITVSVTSVAAALPDHPAKQITICNSSEADVTVTQDGNPLVVIARSYFTFSGVSNTNQLSLESPTDVTVYVRWVA